MVRPEQPLAAGRGQPPARPPALPRRFNLRRPWSLELTCMDDPRGKCDLCLRGDDLCQSYSSSRPHRFLFLPRIYYLVGRVLPHQHFRPTPAQREGHRLRGSRDVVVRLLGLLAGPPPAGEFPTCRPYCHGLSCRAYSCSLRRLSGTVNPSGSRPEVLEDLPLRGKIWRKTQNKSRGGADKKCPNV